MWFHLFHFLAMFVNKNTDKLFIVFLFLVVLVAFVFDPDRANAETYKPLLSSLGGCLFGMVKGGAPQTPVTTTTTESPATGDTTQTTTEIKS